MVLLPENLFPIFLYESMNLFYIDWFQLKVQWKKIRDGYRQVVEKREEETRSGAAKANPATVEFLVYFDFCTQ